MIHKQQQVDLLDNICSRTTIHKQPQIDLLDNMQAQDDT